MMIANTSERVSSLFELSDHIYPAIDQKVGGEPRARQILVLGVNTVAHAMLKGMKPDEAGRLFQSQLQGQLERGGMTPAHYTSFSVYRSVLDNLPPEPGLKPVTLLGNLPRRYADVKRRTLDAKDERETNARHVAHLTGLALPYAAKYHPHLAQGKVALYCLIHDILEAYTGDVATLGITKEESEIKRQCEARAFMQMKAEYESIYPRLVSTVEAYEHLADDEAKFVKTFDKLDPSFTHFANSGLQLRKYYGYSSDDSLLADTAKTRHAMQRYGEQFPDLLESHELLVQRVAKRAFPSPQIKL